MGKFFKAGSRTKKNRQKKSGGGLLGQLARDMKQRRRAQKRVNKKVTRDGFFKAFGIGN